MPPLTMHAIAILGALVAPLPAISSALRHTGRGHRHPHVRQDFGSNGRAAGLSDVIPPPAVLPGPISSPTLTALRDTMLPTSTRPDISSTSISPPDLSSYKFPSKVIQVAVASVCPDTPPSSIVFPILPTDPASYIMTNTTTSHGSIETIVLPVFVNATMLLSNGSSVTFLSLSTSTATVIPELPEGLPQSIEPPSVETARIILDSNGCQTVYSAKTIPDCDTTLSIPGMVPVPITDCDQWVTFSSQSLGDCAGADRPTSQVDPISTLKALTSTVSISPRATQTNGPMAYYVAHWYELIRGPVPEIVEVETCRPEWISNVICQTLREQWNVVYDKKVLTTSSVASFRGPAILTSSTQKFTTYLDIFTTITAYETVTKSSISRKRIATEAPSSTPQRTVTVVVSTPSTRTLLLEEVAKETNTTVTEKITIVETTTVQVTETRTRNISTAIPETGVGGCLDI